MMRRYFGPILALVALLSITLGLYGSIAYDQGASWTTAFYRTIQLFYWNGSFGAPVPLPLEIARWLAPMVTMGALIQVAISLSRKHWDAFRAARLHNHVVICGGGVTGRVLAAELRRQGKPAVILEKDSARAEELAELGEIVVHGDAGEAQALRKAGAARSARLVVATGDDHANLAVAMAAAQTGVPLIHTHGSNAALCDLYRRHSALAHPHAKGDVKIRIFDKFRNIARSTIQVFPPDPPEGASHVVLPDLGAQGRALAFESAVTGQLSGDRRVSIHVVCPGAVQAISEFRQRFPGIDQCADLRAVELPTPDLFSREVASLARAAGGMFTVFTGLDDENEAFSRALELVESATSLPLLRLVLPGAPGSPARMLVERNPVLGSRIGFLPDPETTCGTEAVFGEALDRTARFIHENWLKETNLQIAKARAGGDEALARRHEAKATYKPWEDLSEEQKGASRSQADHIPFKIRAAGLDPGTVTKSAWDALSDAQIEPLARMEHARWAAYYWMTGWTFAPERDDALKVHPNLVPYEDLDEPTRDYDRLAVRHVGLYLP